MLRPLFAAAAALLLVASSASAQAVRSGTVAKLDAEQKQITLKVDGKEETFKLSDGMRVFDADGGSLAERFAKVGIKAGSAIMFRADPAGDVLNAVKAGGPNDRGPNTQRTPGAPVSPEHSSLKPLTELGSEKYQGFVGGLYPDGANERPSSHEAAGLKLAATVRPLDAEGRPDDAAGKIVLLSIGMSNTTQLSQGFRAALGEASGINPRFQFVDGAQGGMTAAAIEDPDDDGRGKRYWSVVDERLSQAGATRAQVQAVWIKQADAGPSEGFPGYARKLQGELVKILNVVQKRFPNVKLAYLSSRTYGGFATTKLNPEPYAYESGFSVKWLIEQQLDGDAALNYDPAKGDVKAPWASWGPYLWANGAKKRTADGFSYAPEDFGGDGTHHSQLGQRKGGDQLLKFFSTDSTTKSWFLAR